MGVKDALMVISTPFLWGYARQVQPTLTQKNMPERVQADSMLICYS